VNGGIQEIVVRFTLLAVSLVAAGLAWFWARPWRTWGDVARATAAAAVSGASGGLLTRGVGGALQAAVLLGLVGASTTVSLGPGPETYARWCGAARWQRTVVGIAWTTSILAFVVWLVSPRAAPAWLGSGVVALAGMILHLSCAWRLRDRPWGGSPGRGSGC
jgi:hypothetical protein